MSDTGDREFLLLVEATKAKHAVELEKYRHECAINLEGVKAGFTGHIALGSPVVAFAGAVFRGLTLVNSGGILSILTFVGKLYTKSADEAHAKAVALQTFAAVYCFVCGLVSVLLAVGTSYVSQIILMEVARTGRKNLGHHLRVIACLLCASSLALFSWGAIIAIRGLAI